MSCHLGNGHSAVATLRKLGIGRTSRAAPAVYELPDWAAAAARAPSVGLGAQGWQTLFQALLLDEDLRGAVEATAALAGQGAPVEKLLRERVPEAFAWADEWSDAIGEANGWRP